MKYQPLISVALCTYNGAAFLEEQVISILNQSHQNIEIVILDDCSSDETYTLIQQMAQKYEAVKSYKNETNLGFNRNFEKAIALCSGDYIAISDQDDVWEPNKLQVLLDHIGDNWLVFSNSSYIDEEGKFMEGQLLHNLQMGNRDYKSLTLYNFVTGHTSMFSREFIENLFPIPHSGYYDWWMGFVALYHKKLSYVNQQLTQHRIHKKSVMQQLTGSSDFENEYIHYKEISTNLNLLRQYKNLTAEDHTFLTKLYGCYLDKDRRNFNFPLLRIIFTHYSSLFPDLKRRGLLSKLNFAHKLSSPLSPKPEVK